jgi:hypothetical protein
MKHLCELHSLSAKDNETFFKSYIAGIATAADILSSVPYTNDILQFKIFLLANFCNVSLKEFKGSIYPHSKNDR